jgi:hypothetical protein
MLQAKDKSHLQLVLEIWNAMDVRELERRMIGQNHIHSVKIMYVSLLISVPIVADLEYAR